MLLNNLNNAIQFYMKLLKSSQKPETIEWSDLWSALGLRGRHGSNIAGFCYYTSVKTQFFSSFVNKFVNSI